jgi:hypothetical protein
MLQLGFGSGRRPEVLEPASVLGAGERASREVPFHRRCSGCESVVAPSLELATSPRYRRRRSVTSPARSGRWRVRYPRYVFARGPAATGDTQRAGTPTLGGPAWPRCRASTPNAVNATRRTGGRSGVAHFFKHFRSLRDHSHWRQIHRPTPERSSTIPIDSAAERRGGGSTFATFGSVVASGSHPKPRP